MRNPSAVLHGAHDLRIEDRPVPAPASGQVLVEAAAVGICGSEVHDGEHGRIGPDVVNQPMVVGRESAGTVVGVGEGVATPPVGELITHRFELADTEHALTIARSDPSALKPVVLPAWSSDSTG